MILGDKVETDLFLNHHISRRFNAELEQTRNQVMKMGGLVESQLEQGLNALLNYDVDLAQQVIDNDALVNGLEIEIDEQCTQIMARRQPAASDLRLMITVIKTITDLERIGDEAIKLGRNAIEIYESNSRPRPFSELRSMGEQVKTMLRRSLDAYARMDVDEALRIIESDKLINGEILLINEEFDNISRLLLTRMMEDPREIKNSLRINQCARAMERIGDHSANICEFIVYLVQGKDVRHDNDKVMPKDLL